MKTKLLLLFTALCALGNAQTNYALNFNGTSDYVDLGSAAATGVRSIELWFKPSVNITPSISDPTYVLVGRNDNTELHEYGLDIVGNDAAAAQRGFINFYISSGGTYYFAISNNSSWSAGTWYHVCGTIDAVTGMKLYVNGVLQTTTGSYTNPIPAATEISTLGRWGNLAIRYFPGIIDEVRFWNRTISAAEIQQKMCYWLVPANETGLTSYWKMNEGSGSTIFDATTGANNGNIIGATYVQDNNCFAGTIGINEHSEQASVSLYPNPFTNQTTLQVKEKLSNATLAIYNLVGQEVKQVKNISGQTITLNRDGLPEGIYFIKLTQDGKTFITKKLVISDN